MDYETGKIVLEVIARINEERGTTVVVITHNASHNASISVLADRILKLASGRIVSDVGNPNKLSSAKLTW